MFPLQSLACIVTPLYILACLSTWHLLASLTCLHTIWCMLACPRIPLHTLAIMTSQLELHFSMTLEPYIHYNTLALPSCHALYDPPQYPKLMRRSTKVTIDQDFSLLASPTKPEKALSMKS